MIEIIGLIAGFLTGIGLVPQLVKTYKTKLAEDISYGLLILTFIGVFLWLLYGILIWKIPVIIANIATVLGYGLLIIMKIVYKGK